MLESGVREHVEEVVGLVHHGGEGFPGLREDDPGTSKAGTAEFMIYCTFAQSKLNEHLKVRVGVSCAVPVNVLYSHFANY